MKYITNQFPTKFVGTVFSMTTPNFKYNEVTHTLDPDGETDDYALVQSSADCALSSVLERFGFVPEEYARMSAPQRRYVDVEEEPEDFFVSARARLNAEADQLAEQLRQKYGSILPEEILSKLKNEAVSRVLAKSKNDDKQEKGGEFVETKDTRQEE